MKKLFLITAATSFLITGTAIASNLNTSVDKPNNAEQMRIGQPNRMPQSNIITSQKNTEAQSLQQNKQPKQEKKNVKKEANRSF